MYLHGTVLAAAVLANGVGAERLTRFDGDDRAADKGTVSTASVAGLVVVTAGSAAVSVVAEVVNPWGSLA